MKLEPANIVCPKCGSPNYMRHLIGKGVGKLDMKCINCNSYFNFDELYKQKIAEVLKPKPQTNADRTAEGGKLMYDELIALLREAPDDWPDAELHYQAADAIEELSAKATSKRDRGLLWGTSPCYSCKNKNVYEPKYGYFACNYSGRECNNKNFPMYRPRKQIAPEPPKEES